MSLKINLALQHYENDRSPIMYAIISLSKSHILLKYFFNGALAHHILINFFKIRIANDDAYQKVPNIVLRSRGEKLSYPIHDEVIRIHV